MNLVFNPHESQLEYLEERGRFSVLNCGRRWGKTSIALFLILQELSKTNKQIAYYAPTSARYKPFWRKLNKYLLPLNKKTLDINLSYHEVTLHAGGFLKLWSLEDRDSGRGEEYDLVIIDEAAYAPYLEQSWENVIRATLLDRKGSAVLLSTPGDPSGFFYEVSVQAQELKRKNWTYYHAPTWKNNLLDLNEIEEIKADLPEEVFDQEYGAQFLTRSEDAFFYSKKSILFNETKVFRNYPLWLSFDFNVNPCTLIIGQKLFEPRSHNGGLYIHDELQVQGTTRELCVAFKNTPYWEHRGGFFITGDKSGTSFDVAADVLHNNFDIIKNSLRLTDHQLINTHGRNPLFSVSRNSCNTVMHNQILTIDPKCKILKKDIETAKLDKYGKLMKDRDRYKMDACDAFRYMINAWFPDSIPEIRSFLKVLDKRA